MSHEIVIRGGHVDHVELTGVHTGTVVRRGE